MPVALGYIRRSMIRRGERTDSPEKQQSAIQRVCQEKGWTLELFQDAEEGKHFSGRSELGRPAWQELKRQLPREEVAAVVVNSLDRASRSPKDFFNFMDLLQQHEVALVSCKEQFDTSTAMGRAFLSVLLVVASLESDMAGERVSATIQHRQSSGVHWGNTPYGYKRLEDGSMIESPDGQVVDGELLKDAAAIRLAYDLYATGHWSFYQIGKRLNDLGYRMTNRYRKRHPFERRNVRIFLYNHWLYRGWLIPGGENHIDEHNEAQPPPEAIRGQFPALVSLEVAQAVTAVLQQRRRTGPVRKEQHSYILTPLLHCATCGQKLRGKTSRNRHYYSHYVRACQEGPGDVPADAVEEEMLDAIQGLTVPEGWRAEIRTMLEKRLDALREQSYPDQVKYVEQLRGRLNRMRDVYILGDITSEEYRARRDQLLTEIKQVESSTIPQPYDLDTIIRRLDEFGQLIANAARDGQKKALAAMFRRLDAEKTKEGWQVHLYPKAALEQFF